MDRGSIPRGSTSVHISPSELKTPPDSLESGGVLRFGLAGRAAFAAACVPQAASREQGASAQRERAESGQERRRARGLLTGVRELLTQNQLYLNLIEMAAEGVV